MPLGSVRAACVAFFLASCGADERPVVIEPKMACAQEVRCHVLAWQLGFKFGPSIAGTHIVCRCDKEP
jgi:hypothetical protein